MLRGRQTLPPCTGALPGSLFIPLFPFCRLVTTWRGRPCLIKYQQINFYDGWRVPISPRQRSNLSTLQHGKKKRRNGERRKSRSRRIISPTTRKEKKKIRGRWRNESARHFHGKVVFERGCDGGHKLEEEKEVLIDPQILNARTKEEKGRRQSVNGKVRKRCAPRTQTTSTQQYKKKTRTTTAKPLPPASIH